MWDFIFPDVCYKFNTAEKESPHRFLESLGDNILTQLVKETTRKGAPLDVLLVNREGSVGDAMLAK